MNIFITSGPDHAVQKCFVIVYFAGFQSLNSPGGAYLHIGVGRFRILGVKV